MTRTTASLSAALLLGAVAPSAAQLRAPETPRGRPVEYEAAARVFGRSGLVEPVAETVARWQYEGKRPYRSIAVGAYARSSRRIKLGMFWRVQYGARHDDDWVREAPGHWVWRDTTRRPEHVLVLDATPRAQLTFLPGRWTASLKLRWEHNTFNQEGTAKFEPELAWFWMDGMAPRATVFLRHGTYLPLNFGGRRVYERWWYLAGLWHPTPEVSVGPSVALRDEFWNTSTQYRAAAPRGVGYRALYRSVVAGVTVVGRWR